MEKQTAADHANRNANNIYQEESNTSEQFYSQDEANDPKEPVKEPIKESEGVTLTTNLHDNQLRVVDTNDALNSSLNSDRVAGDFKETLPA